MTAEIHTKKGVMKIKFFEKDAPNTVKNFVTLAEKGFYNGLTFHRVIPDFVIQGGNIWTREAGKVSKEMGARARRTIPDEPNKILHERGVVSMARADEANTATSNFFILVDSAPSLDGKFAAFGRVTKGMEVVDAINKVSVTDEKPEKPVKVKKASISLCPAQ